MMQTITPAAIETTKEMIMTVREAETPIDNARLIQVALRMGSPTLKQPTFDCRMADEYHELNVILKWK